MFISFQNKIKVFCNNNYYTEKFFCQLPIFKIFTHQKKFFAIFLLNGVLKRAGLFIQPCPQSGVLR